MTKFDFSIVDSGIKPSRETPERAWTIAIVDDEQSVHDATRLALKNVELQGRPLRFESAYSGADGLELLKRHPDTAVILLDVVMETNDAGLRLVEQIRTVLNNNNIQIVLRTGQPGTAPEEDVITRYAINAYKTKNELTRTQLITTIATALRSYNHISTLEESKRGLQLIIDGIGQLFQERSVSDFAHGVLRQISALYNISAESMFCVSQEPQKGPLGIDYEKIDNYTIVAATQKFRNFFGQDLNSLDKNNQAVNIVLEALKTKAHVTQGRFFALYLSTPSMWNAVVVAECANVFKQSDVSLLEVFCMNISLGLENAKFFNYLNQIAFYDKLTGLANRVGFLSEAKEFSLAQNDNVILYMIDVDYFHHIVESFGYEFGDKILIEIAHRLRKLHGQEPVLARLHSDVFVVLLPEEKFNQSSNLIAASSSIEIGIHTIRLGVTMGATRYQYGGQLSFDAERLLRQASMALNGAKLEQRGSLAFFDESYETSAKQSIETLSGVRRALSLSLLSVVLQPKVNATTRRVVGFEALVRWNDGEGVIMPDQFLGAVEKSGLFFEFDLHVANLVCQVIREWRVAGVPISLNLSANSIHHERFVDELIEVFERNAVGCDEVELEVTETALVHSDTAIESLKRLSALGFKICLDDFGVGYSALHYLQRLPLDTIKVDGSFVANITTDSQARALLGCIVEICRILHKEIVVERVETEEQLAQVMEMGVEIIQGYLFYRPLPVADAFALLEAPSQ